MQESGDFPFTNVPVQRIDEAVKREIRFIEEPIISRIDFATMQLFKLVVDHITLLSIISHPLIYELLV